MKAVNRRDFLKTTGLGAVSLGLPGRLGAATAGPAGKPNIIFVFADQMRFCEMGCAGNKAIRTPNLDRLASQGGDAFQCIQLHAVVHALCAQLITGRYGPATTLINNDIHLPDNEITIAKVLKAQGTRRVISANGTWTEDGGRSRATRGSWDMCRRSRGRASISGRHANAITNISTPFISGTRRTKCRRPAMNRRCRRILPSILFPETRRSRFC